MLTSRASSVLHDTNFTGKSREYIADALVNTELEYVKSLETVDGVRNRLQQLLELERPVLNEKEIDRMFLNLHNITDFHKDLSKELLTLRLEGPHEFLRKLGQTFFQFIPFFKLYASYIGNYRSASQYINKKLQQSKQFRAFVELEERCFGEAKSLKSLLGLPMGRLPQYLNILFAIHSRPGNVGSQLAKSILAIQEVSDAISAEIKLQVARKMVVTVQNKVFGNTVNVLGPSRHVVKKGELRVTMPLSRPRHFTLTRPTAPKMYLVVLFNDFILVGSAKKRPLGNRKVKVLMRVAGLECEDPEDGTHSFVLRTNLGGVETAMVLYAQNAEQKMKWLAAIDRVLEEYMHCAHEEYLDSIGEFEALVLKKKQKKNHQPEPKIRNPVPIDQTVIHMHPVEMEFSSDFVAAGHEPETIQEEEEEDLETMGSPWQKVEGTYYLNTRTLERTFSLDEKTGIDEKHGGEQKRQSDTETPREAPMIVPLTSSSSTSSCYAVSASTSSTPAPSHSRAQVSLQLNDVPVITLPSSPAQTPVNFLQPSPMHSPSVKLSSPKPRTLSRPGSQRPLDFSSGDIPTPPGSPPRAPEPPSSPPRQSLKNVPASKTAVRAVSEENLLAALQSRAATLKKVTPAPAPATPPPSSQDNHFFNAINESIAAYIQSIRPLIQEEDDLVDPEDWT